MTDEAIPEWEADSPSTAATTRDLPSGERLRRLEHRFRNEVEGEYVADTLQQSRHTIEELVDALVGAADRLYDLALSAPDELTKRTNMRIAKHAASLIAKHGGQHD